MSRYSLQHTNMSSNHRSFLQESSIELVIIGQDGIVQSISEQPVFGSIKDLAVLPWSNKFHVQNPKVCSAHWFMLVHVCDSHDWMEYYLLDCFLDAGEGYVTCGF